MTHSSGPLSPGTILKQRYEILEELGRGSMAVVYRARTLPEGDIVAVKILGEELRHNHEVLARFRREAQIGNRIQHPNVVKVLDYDLTPEGFPFLVEEFLNGKDLQSRLEAGDSLALGEITYLFIALCDALEAAHELGIVHRDLKPGNVFLGRGPKGELQVKLIDFGLAKLLNNTDGVALTAHLGVVGTPAYMAPEQLRGEPLDPRADIYSMGVMLYQLLTGSLPFWSDNALDIADKVLSEKAVDVRRRAQGRQIPAALAKLTMKAIAKHPDQRPQNVLLFREKLLEIRRDFSNGGPPDGFFRRLFFRFGWK